MITNAEPGDWQSLQTDVANLLAECGFRVEVEHPTRTVRGQVSIDVFATEARHGREYVVLCECKNWKTNVHQQVVHGFRTVVNDTGANVGYIIASSGFQAGAHREAEMTNVRLVTWQGFQDEFENAWLHQFMMPTLERELAVFLRLTEPLVAAGYADLSAEGQRAFDEACKTYHPLHMLALQFSPHLRLRDDIPFPSLPLSGFSSRWIEGVSPDLLVIKGYRELMLAMIEQARTAVSHLRSLLSATTL